ncbi:MAG: polysaccharide biosynthesis C-terminal domain-containing protein [Blastocatellia bacterium]|nr:polysaccharide biosynthesis C-terminal domain-containing protein [Blastocatellia bacterium]
MAGLGSVLTLAMSSLAGIAVARNAGPSGYAIFVAANMIVFVGSVLCSLGLPLALAKHVAVEEEIGRHEALRKANTTILILLSGIALCIGIGGSYYVPTLEQHLHITFGFGFALAFPLILLCAVTSDCIQGIYYGLLRPRIVIGITVSGPAIALIYVLARRSGAALPIWGAVAALYVTSGLTAIVLLGRDRLLGRPAPIRELTEVFKDLVPAATFTFFTVFSSWSDRWIVGAQLGAVAMGSYAAAVVVIQTALRIPTHLAYLLVPASSRISLGGKEKSEKLNSVTLTMFGSFAALMTVILLLAGESVMKFLFGPAFAPAGQALATMALCLLASAISIPFISVLTGSKRNRFVTYLLGLTIIPRILLLSFFTRRWNLQGTAVAIVLSESFLAVCCLLLSRTMGLGFHLRALIRPYLAGLVAYCLGLIAIFFGAPKLLATGIVAVLLFLALWRLARSTYFETFQRDSALSRAHILENS